MKLANIVAVLAAVAGLALAACSQQQQAPPPPPPPTAPPVSVGK